MKFLLIVLAALLLLIFIACKERVNTNSSKEPAKPTVSEVQLYELKQDEPAKQYSPVQNDKALKFSPPVIVSDREITTVLQDGIVDEGKVMINPKIEEERNFNTEDYDNIVENKFLAATQNPLSTFLLM